MADEPLAFSPDQFSGLARVFPLPNLVMFPHVMQALHIFEPRYRAMLEEAIEDDRLIALGVLAPGWEQHYEGRPHAAVDRLPLPRGHAPADARGHLQRAPARRAAAAARPRAAAEETVSRGRVGDPRRRSSPTTRRRTAAALCSSSCSPPSSGRCRRFPTPTSSSTSCSAARSRWACSPTSSPTRSTSTSSGRCGCSRSATSSAARGCFSRRSPRGPRPRFRGRFPTGRSACAI